MTIKIKSHFWHSVYMFVCYEPAKIEYLRRLEHRFSKSEVHMKATATEEGMRLHSLY